MDSKGKVLKFPGSPVREVPAGNDAEQGEEQRGAEAPEPKGLRALRVVGGFLRWLLFMVLYWLRTPIVGLCGILSVGGLFATLFVWYAFPEHANMRWGFGTVSFVACIIMWAYDYVLMQLSPTPLVNTL